MDIKSLSSREEKAGEEVETLQTKAWPKLKPKRTRHGEEKVEDGRPHRSPDKQP